MLLTRQRATDTTLDIDAKEGLGEEIHFLYDDGLDVIAVQRKGQFRATALENLLSELSKNNVSFEIILRGDALDRFDRMELVKKVYFKLARPQDLAAQPQHQPLLSVLRTIEDFRGVSAKVEISVGRHQDMQLNRNPVRGLIDMYRARGDNFKALSITGAIREQDGFGLHVDTVDFIQGKLSYTSEVKRQGRRLSPEGCRLALREAIRENREYLRRYKA